MTYPEIGNYGVNAEDVESGRPHLAGFVVRQWTRRASNFRATGELDDYLAQWGVVGLAGIDTRALVRHIRNRGAMRGVLSTVDLDDQRLVAKAKASPGLVGRDLVREVIPSQPRDWQERLNPWARAIGDIRGDSVEPPAESANSAGPHVVAIDYGMKWNIARHLADMGCRVTILPGTASAEEILALQPDGVFLSNGPGDPEPLAYAIDAIRGVLGRTPVFGICLGHQLLSLACGAKTFKLKFGHRGANQPVLNLETGRVEITSQNHGFAVVEEESAARVGSDASQSERPDDRRRAASRAAGLQRAISSRSVGRPARQQLSVRQVPRIARHRRLSGMAGSGIRENSRASSCGGNSNSHEFGYGKRELQLPTWQRRHAIVACRGTDCSRRPPVGKSAPGWIFWNLALMILVSAFLLFQVEPLISKFILPWFGGSPAVWTTCLLFFQSLLFCGYAYAHLISRLFTCRGQAILHGVLLVAAIVTTAGRAGGKLEARFGRRSDVANPRAAHLHGRAALFRSLGHRAVGTSLVQPGLSGTLALSALRTVERRLAGGADDVSVPVRAGVYRSGASLVLVGRIWGVRRLMRLGGILDCSATAATSMHGRDSNPEGVGQAFQPDGIAAAACHTNGSPASGSSG